MNSNAIPSFLISVRIIKKQNAIKWKSIFFLKKSLLETISTYIKNVLKQKYTATRPSAQPLNKNFPIVKKIIDKKIRYWVSFQNA